MSNGPFDHHDDPTGNVIGCALIVGASVLFLIFGIILYNSLA